MGKLKAYLEDTQNFTVVTEGTTAGVEVCTGRVRDVELWNPFMTQLLAAEAQGVENNLLSSNVLSISKQYMWNVSRVAYLWRIVCSDVAWLEEHGPRVEKASWASKFRVDLTKDGSLAGVHLVSSDGYDNRPTPESLGIGHSL